VNKNIRSKSESTL